MPCRATGALDHRADPGGERRRLLLIYGGGADAGPRSFEAPRQTGGATCATGAGGAAFSDEYAERDQDVSPAWVMRSSLRRRANGSALYTLRRSFALAHGEAASLHIDSPARQETRKKKRDALLLPLMCPM